MAKKSKIGRPEKFDPEYCELLIDHMDEGLSYESFAGRIGVAVSTLYVWEKKHAEFSEAKKKAWARCLLYWERLGIQGATGKLEKKGRNEISNGKNVNAALWIYNMKCRFPKTWRDTLKIESDDDESGRKKKPERMLNYARIRKD